MFEGFRSRCKIPRSCACWIAPAPPKPADEAEPSELGRRIPALGARFLLLVNGGASAAARPDPLEAEQALVGGTERGQLGGGERPRLDVRRLLPGGDPGVEVL